MKYKRTCKAMAASAALILTAGASIAQTFACQYTRSVGFQYIDGRYQADNFVAGEPFFLKVEDKKLAPKSLEALGFIAASDAPLKCSDHVDPIHGFIHMCSSHLGSSIIFNSGLERGSISTLLGSVSYGDERASVGVSLFVCQEM